MFSNPSGTVHLRYGKYETVKVQNGPQRNVKKFGPGLDTLFLIQDPAEVVNFLIGSLVFGLSRFADFHIPREDDNTPSSGNINAKGRCIGGEP